MAKGRQNIAYYYLFCLVSPLLASGLAIFNLPWKAKKWVFIFTITLFGSVILLGTTDGYVLKQHMYNHYTGLTFNQWLFELKQLLLFSPEPGTKGDVYHHTISYLLGEVLGMPALFFVVVAFVYACLYISAMSKVLRWDQGHAPGSFLFWSLVVLFVSYRFIDSLQTVRTWTGLWVLYLGVYGYFSTGKWKYLLLMAAAPLFHVAYFLMALPAFAAVFFRKVPLIYFVVAYLLSFQISLLPQGFLQSRIESSGEIGAAKLQSYYDEEANVYQAGSSGPFYKKFGKHWALKNGPHLFFFSLILGGFYRKNRLTHLEKGLLSTGLLLAILANSSSEITALYNRTMVNAGIYAISVPLLLYLRGALFRSKDSKVNLFVKRSTMWISFFAFVPYLIYTLSFLSELTSIYMISFPLLGLFESANISIKEFIRLFV